MQPKHVTLIAVEYEAEVLPRQEYQVTWNADGTCRLWHEGIEVCLPQTQAWLAQLQKASQDASAEEDASCEQG